jgi:hypothetical protein
MVGILAIIAATVIAIVVLIVMISRKLGIEKAHSAVLRSRADQANMRAHTAEGLAFRMTDVADKALLVNDAVQVAKAIHRVSRQMDELMSEAPASPDRGRHIKIVPPSQHHEGHVA